VPGGGNGDGAGGSAGAGNGAVAAWTSTHVAATQFLLWLEKRAVSTTVWRSYLPEVSPA
jgi:hypothetical protein